MTYRSSPFIDFNTDTVTTAPMDLIRGVPRPWSLDQKIEIYECMIEVWQLGAAVAMLRQIESHQPPSSWSHAAYGLVSMTFSYFEMIGKSLNPNSGSSGTAGTDFNYGFCDVYPTFAPSNGIYSDKIPQASGPWPINPDIQSVVQFRDRIRNGIYHLGYTKSGVLIHNNQPHVADFEERSAPDPSNPSQSITQYFMNPHSFLRTIVDHFPGFIAKLRVTGNTTLRQKFEQFFDQFISP